MSNRYFYLEVDLIVSAAEVRELRAALAAWGGEAAPRVDVLGAGRGRSVLRVRGAELRHVRAALALLPARGMQRCESATGPGGKDVVVVAGREALAAPSSAALPPPAPAPGLLLPDGSINWGCPCLGGMATGPCGEQFRDAFSCFHYSDAEPKGSDCYEKFSVMQECMAEFPELYGKDEDDELAAAVQASRDQPDPAAPPPDEDPVGGGNSLVRR